MFDQWCSQVTALLLGALLGLLVGKVTRAIIAVVALSGVAAAALILTGHEDVVREHADCLPRAVSLAGQVAGALKMVMSKTPAALLGALASLCFKEVVRLIKAR